MTKFVYIDKIYQFESNTFHMIKECKNLTFKDVNGNLFFHTKTLTYDQIDSDGHEYYSSNSNNYIGFDPSNTMYFHTKLNNQIGSAATMTSSLSEYDNSPASNFLPESGSSVGVFVRFIFDGLGIGDGTGANYKSVPATYLHNAIYAPNPIYNIWKPLPPNNPGGNATATTVLLKYDNNMFSLLPAVEHDLPKSNKFHDSSNLQNNALYAHDANACDKRYNQYYKTVGNCNKPGDNSSSCSPLNDFGYKFGVNGAFQCDNTNVMIYSDSDESSASGNVARGKGIHEWVSNNNVRNKVSTPSWNPFRDYNQLNDVSYISTSDNCTLANNTLGKWSPDETTFHSFYDQSLKYHAMGGESCYADKTTTTTLGTYVSQWKKITDNCNKDQNSYCDMLQAAPDFGSTADYTLSCQDAIDYIIPWTDNLHLLIHLQNTLWEQYGWNPKSRQKGCIQDLGHPSPCLSGNDPYWYGWNEIPIRNSIMAWPMQKDTQYTLAVYLDMNNFNPTLDISEDGFIKVTDLKLQSDQKDPTRTIWNMICYGMDGNCGVVNYINKINTTTTAYKPITYKLVFFIQKEQTAKTGMNIWSKRFITIDPKSVGSAKILQLDTPISFSWNNDCWTYTSQPK